ncbi:oryzin precursor [Hypoxylon sp. FL1284]|nr:oryzin precursor [Hypoxylon sp. FL1284]
MLSPRRLALLGILLSSIKPTRSSLVHGKDSSPSDPGRYIVTLREGLGNSEIEQHLQQTTSLHSRSPSSLVELGERWNIGSWNAYSCTMDKDTLAKLSHDDVVQFVEPDGGLSAISHRVPTNQTDYVYDTTAGEGTYAYILDTGLLTTHDEFEDRASLGHNVVGGPFIDDTGHGTHVAGIIGGKTYGVAKKTRLISVKIFKYGQGTAAAFLEGYHWAVHNITKQHRQDISVINISAGIQAHAKSINQAVEEAYKLGVLTVTAASNGNRDAQSHSPASAPNAMTVGAINRNLRRSSYSNWGSLVDIFAPGNRIYSAGIGSNHDVRLRSGTSVATAHITGLILYLKGLIPYRTKSPASSVRELQKLSTDNVIPNTRGSANKLGFNGNGVVI